MTHPDDAKLAAWLSEGPDHGPLDVLEAAFARLPNSRQRPAWAVMLAGGAIARAPDRPWLGFSLVMATVALVGLVIGAMIGSGVVRLEPAPSPIVIATHSPDATPSLDPLPSATPPSGRGQIVFTRTITLVSGEEDCTRSHCIRSWIAIADDDGANERPLFPDGPPTQYLIARSADGSRLIVQGIDPGDEVSPGPLVYLVDLTGSAPVVLDTGCEFPCVMDHGFAFSPDGQRVAFVRTVGSNPEVPLETSSSLIAIMELDTGAVTELDATLANNPDLGQPCHSGCGDGETESPQWSPDGRQLVFTRTRIGIPNQPRTILDTALFVVNADGSDVRQLVPTELFARDARWSPDGSLIVFTSALETLTRDQFGKLENWHQLNDIHIVRPDGTGLTRLTTFTAGAVLSEPGDIGATRPTWTRDGRIVFTRIPESPEEPVRMEVWVMDSDGSNAKQLDPEDAASLSAIGCVVCPYPPVDPRIWYPTMALWRAEP